MSDKGFNVEAELSGLKGFQRRTVDYVFRRLYTDESPTRKFLIADEVGLGKTLVARGVVARALDHLWDRVEDIRVVYICSNADIARQNINRLGSFARVHTGEVTRDLPRLTLLPTHSALRGDARVSFIPLTPATSFNMSHRLGTGEERALLHTLLDRAWDFGGLKPPLNVLQGNMYSGNFRRLVRWCRNNQDLDEELSSLYVQRLQRETELKERFFRLCEKFPRRRKYLRNIPEADRHDRAALVGELRSLLARISVRFLRPSLVILDEFQRFRSLLSGNDQGSLLARELFDYSSEDTSARVILLSATPYKMYTMGGELGEEDHYRDFIKTLEFLLDYDDEQTGEIEELLRRYRENLLRLGGGDSTARGELVQTVQALESKLRRVMVRTERLADSEDRNGMLEHVPTTDQIRLRAGDVRSYLAYSDIARAAGTSRNLLEYWKSCPYLLNFMEDYEVKRDLEEAVSGPNSAPVQERLRQYAGECLMPFGKWERYERVNPPNARLRFLEEDTLGSEMWKMLWMPPSLPYYEPGGVFRVPSHNTLTKRLIFSTWQVVPKTVAALVSYEVERRMIRSFHSSPENSAEGRRRMRPLLNFSRSSGRLTGMPVMALVYPSSSLAGVIDPTLLTREIDSDTVPTVDDALRYVHRRCLNLLENIDAYRTADGAVDENWYWAAPILMDLHLHPDMTRERFLRPDLADRWQGDRETGEDDDGDVSAWNDHVQRARDLLEGEVTLGRPPEDLAMLMAQLALAGPGTSVLRALSRIAPADELDSSECVDFLDAAARAAWGFRSLFNLPEVMALIRGLNQDEPYWRRTLEYCVDGNLQAVLDEYCHVLVEHLGVMRSTPTEKVNEVSEAIRDVVTLRTSVLAVDEIDPEGDAVMIHRRRMRTHFALRFGDLRSHDGSRLARDSQVRAAFNSPFWPFVLVTTSVGQEGLDFHLYCHAVLHWDLPSNPVDLEQREGRVHRYKGHAVRKNLAKRYGARVRAGCVTPHGSADHWRDLFSAAEDSDGGASDGLHPYWVYAPAGHDHARIMRLVAAMPLSRDLSRLRYLRRALTLYRMVFGQPRQDDMIQYLDEMVPEEEMTSLLEVLRVDLAPMRGDP